MHSRVCDRIASLAGPPTSDPTSDPSADPNPALSQLSGDLQRQFVVASELVGTLSGRLRDLDSRREAEADRITRLSDALKEQREKLVPLDDLSGSGEQLIGRLEEAEASAPMHC